MQIFPFKEFLSQLQVIFKTSPPKPYMQCYSSMHILPFHGVFVTIASHFLNFPPCMRFSASVCQYSFQNRAAKTKFPNPRTWKFPNPTLKFPNPGGKASFRIRGPRSFRIRGPGSFRIRGAASFRIRGLEGSESDAEVSESEGRQVSESEGLEVSESENLEVSESGGQRVSESEGLEVSESDAEVSESEGRQVSESEGLEVSESAAEVSESDVGRWTTAYRQPWGLDHFLFLGWGVGGWGGVEQWRPSYMFLSRYPRIFSCSCMQITLP